MANEENLDVALPAAALRADRGELAVSVEALASSLEEALPGIALVERQKVGGFRSKRREVRRIAVGLGDAQFELAHTEQGIRCSRHRVVRGITLSREELPLAGWLAELVNGVRQSAEISEQDRVALEGLLR
jgi:hypothetical protein